MEIECPICKSKNIFKREYQPRIISKINGYRIEAKFYYCMDCGQEFNIK